MLIALAAKKRHGKDTVADYICREYGYEKYALASPFKNLLCENFGFSNLMINGINFDREKDLNMDGKNVAKGFKAIINQLGYPASVYNIDWSFIENDDQWSIRKLMQIVGTDVGCNLVDKMIWMHPMVEKYNKGINLVISDCRQDHEIELMRKFGAKIIHIINPHIVNDDVHITEAGLPIKDTDIIIENDFDPNNKQEYYRKQSLNELHYIIDGVINGFI